MNLAHGQAFAELDQPSLAHQIGAGRFGQKIDVEAGGDAANRGVLLEELVGKDYWVAGVRSTYGAINQLNPEREYPLKTLIVPGLKVTNEAYNLTQGQNATQTFTFRSNNKLFLVKGYVPFGDLLFSPGLQVT